MSNHHGGRVPRTNECPVTIPQRHHLVKQIIDGYVAFLGVDESSLPLHMNALETKRANKIWKTTGKFNVVINDIETTSINGSQTNYGRLGQELLAGPSMEDV